MKDYICFETGLITKRSAFRKWRATFIKDVETKNVALTLIVGSVLTLFALFQARGVYESFIDPAVHRIFVESIVLPVLPFLIGLYCIYISFKKVPTLLVEKTGEKYKLNVDEIFKKQQLSDLQAYLKSKLHTKLTVRDEF